MNRFLTGIVFCAVLAMILGMADSSVASAHKVNFHDWGRAYVLGDHSSEFPDTACDTGGNLPLSGGQLAVGPCTTPVTPSTDFGGNTTFGNVHYDPVTPGGLSSCSLPTVVTPGTAPCSFLQVAWHMGAGQATVKTTKGLTKGTVTSTATADGVELDLIKTTVAVPQRRALVTVTFDAANTNAACGTASPLPFTCTITLTEDGNAQTPVNWSTPGLANVVVQPPSGTLSPGGTQVVHLTVLAPTCIAEDLPFQIAGDGSATIHLTCPAQTSAVWTGSGAQSAPFVNGAPVVTSAVVEQLFATNELVAAAYTDCRINKNGHVRARATAAAAVTYNDMFIFQNGFFAHFSPGPGANQTAVISTSTPLVSAFVIFNEQKVFVDGDISAMKVTGLHIVATNSTGVVIADLYLDASFAAIHCSKDLPTSEPVPAV